MREGKTKTFNKIRRRVNIGALFKVLENGTPEKGCCECNELKRAWQGLKNTSAHLLFAICWKEVPLTISSSSKGIHETVKNVKKALTKVAEGIFPADLVTKMKTYLNFELKKQNKLMARETVTRLQKVN